jgi:hypothetical protein
MRLSSLKALFLVATVTTGCHESTAAPPEPPVAYMLETVNNGPLPAAFIAAGGDTITVFSAALFLDDATHARVVAHTRKVSPPNPIRDATDTTRYTYRIIGDSIAFEFPCPPDAQCVASPTGTITSSTLTLHYNDPFRATYLYRLPFKPD